MVISDYIIAVNQLLEDKLILDNDVYTLENPRSIFNKEECILLFESLNTKYNLLPIIRDQKLEDINLSRLSTDIHCRESFEMLNLGVKIKIVNKIEIIGYLISKKH